MHRLDHGVHATAGEPHAALTLQIRHDRIDGTGAERVTADEQRVEAEDRAQLRVAEEARHEVVDALRRVQAQQLRDEFQEGGELVEGLAGQVLERALVDVAGGGHEAAIAIDGVGIKGPQLGFDLLGRAAVVEVPPVGEVDAVVRREWHQLDVVVQARARAGPQVVQQVRGGDNAGAHVEGVAVGFELGGAAA